jgi:hypothetical protein
MSEYDDSLTQDGVYATFAMSDNDGNTFSWDEYWLDDEQKQLVRDWISKADTPYIEDSLITDTVCDEGVEYLNGNKSLEDAVKCIMEDIAIYMAE